MKILIIVWLFLAFFLGATVQQEIDLHYYGMDKTTFSNMQFASGEKTMFVVDANGNFKLGDGINQTEAAKSYAEYVDSELENICELKNKK